MKDYSTFPLPYELTAILSVHDNPECLVARMRVKSLNRKVERDGQILEREHPDLQPSMHNKGHWADDVSPSAADWRRAQG